jgi:hypothetical protein
MNKSIIFGLLASVSLVACGSKEEAPAPAEAPAAEAPVEATTPATGEAPEGAQVVVGEPSSSEPAKEPTVVYPAEAAK